jgi:O-antigen ligase
MSKLFSVSAEKAARFFWGLVLLTLPVTSFRYFPLLGKHTYVRPLAFYPLAVLYLILLFRVWRKDINCIRSDSFLPLLFFLLFALFSAGAGALLAPLPMRGQEYWERVLRAFSTLGIGLAFFVAALWMHHDTEDVHFSLKWLYSGLVLSLLWVGIQAIALHTPLLAKEQVSAWQQLFSVRGLTKLKRVSGFAFEASWLAGQIVTLYLPWLVASVLLRFRVTRYRWAEPLLILASLAALLLSYSRGGLLIAVIALGVTLTVGGKNAIAHAFAWFFHPPKNSTKTKIYSVGIRFIIILLAVALVFGSITFLAGQKYVSRLWTVNANSISDYFVKTSAGGRFTYLWAEWQLFVAHPVLGTGLGSSGLYLYQYFPDWALYNNPEITQHLSPTSSLYPNSKNLYLRLLAETGIIGFSIFMAFLSGILAKIGYFLLRPQYKLAGIAGLFSFVAVVTYYLMQDSFAMAELWINFGILLGLSAGTLEESAKESFRLNV